MRRHCLIAMCTTRARRSRSHARRCGCCAGRWAAHASGAKTGVCADAGRALNAVRDARVLVQTLNSLGERHPRLAGRCGLSGIVRAVARFAAPGQAAVAKTGAGADGGATHTRAGRLQCGSLAGASGGGISSARPSGASTRQAGVPRAARVSIRTITACTNGAKRSNTWPSRSTFCTRFAPPS